ncbi:MAG: hypothetical protein ABR508_08730 [Candidatus Baltobacteraceae bacterium]
MSQRFQRDLLLTLILFADGIGLDSITLFSKWQPDAALCKALRDAGITLIWRPLSDIPE